VYEHQTRPESIPLRLVELGSLYKALLFPNTLALLFHAPSNANLLKSSEIRKVWVSPSVVAWLPGELMSIRAPVSPAAV